MKGTAMLPTVALDAARPQAAASQPSGPPTPGPQAPGLPPPGPQAPGPPTPGLPTPGPQAPGLQSPGQQTPRPQAAGPQAAGPDQHGTTPPGRDGGPFRRLLPPAAYSTAGLAAHIRWFGQLPYRGRPGSLIRDVRAAGLTGRGGAAFPVWRKLEAVLGAAGRPVVVGNGAEGEPASHKDKTLLTAAPHLVLDGLQLAAEAVRADSAVLYVCCDRPALQRLSAIVAERAEHGIDRTRVRIVSAPPRFLAGQESALASVVSGGAALPRFALPRVSERGVDGRPTLVQNVETLAHLALIARYGPGWFRSAGTPDEPGTMLCTVRQESSAHVAETPLGEPVDSLISLAGTQAVLVGGYHGAWIPSAQATGLPLSNAALRPLGGSVGAGVLAALPADRCGLVETARVARYLALESAGQCGPCRNGLPRIATALAQVADLRPRSAVLDDLSRWAGLADGRGACGHPDGTVRFVRSALRTFAGEIRRHLGGTCSASCDRHFLPIADGPTDDADWS